MLTRIKANHTLRQLLAGIGLFVCLIILSQQISRLLTPEQMAVDDYVEYWAAARINLRGGNPYDPDQLLPLQIQAGRVVNVPLMMWNPPWTLAVVMPFGLFSFAVGRLIWFILHLAIILICAAWLWELYGGQPNKRWLAWILAIFFAPTLQVLKVGQISPLFLLGIVGFMIFERRQNNLAAGGLAALIAIKPHLLYLFYITFILWAIHQRRWTALVGCGAALLAAMVVSLAVNPQLINQYIYATTNYPPQEYATPTLGGVLRLLLGSEHFWVQFLPSALFGIWFVYYWWRNRSTWIWAEKMPLICLLSVSTASYGWIFDQSVLSLSVLQVGVLYLIPGRAGVKIILATIYVSANLLASFLKIPQIYFFWLAPMFLALYLTALHYLKPKHAEEIEMTGLGKGEITQGITGI